MNAYEKSWSENRSITLSRGLIFVSAALLAALDMGLAWACLTDSTTVFRLGTFSFLPHKVRWFAACVYACNFPAFVLLWNMNRLLANLRRGIVYVAENVRLLRTVSYCCFAACLICLGFGAAVPTVLMVFFAAGFMGLIVRIVKNAFEQAVAMQDELDFTV